MTDHHRMFWLEVAFLAVLLVGQLIQGIQTAATATRVEHSRQKLEEVKRILDERKARFDRIESKIEEISPD